MGVSFEEALIDVWRQVLVENAKIVELGPEHYQVRRTPTSRLRQVDFVFEGNNLRGLEQNPHTAPLAEMARSGDKVMQFSRMAASGKCGCGKVSLYGSG